MNFKSNYSRALLVVFTSILLIGTSCKDDGINSDAVPIIDLVSVELEKDHFGKDSVLRITISYEDGDGDIGLERSDTFPPFHPGSEFQFNLVVDIFDCSGNDLKPLLIPGTNDTMNFNQRIPNLTPTGKNKSISGDITVRYDASTFVLYPDKVMANILIIDRALHRSNQIKTNCIELTH